MTKKIFISHSSKDKKLATDISFFLKEYYYLENVDDKSTNLHCSSDPHQGQTDKNRITNFLDETEIFIQIITMNSLSSISVAYERGYYDGIIHNRNRNTEFFSISCGVTHKDNELFTNTSYINDISLNKEEFSKNFISFLTGIKNKEQALKGVKSNIINNQIERAFHPIDQTKRILKITNNFQISQSYVDKLIKDDLAIKYENGLLYLTQKGSDNFFNA
jgi:predicted transcriptional regulator